MKYKEYKLKIIYNPETGEIKHLSEYDESSDVYTLQVGDEFITISNEMGQYLEKYTDCDILGLS